MFEGMFLLVVTHINYVTKFKDLGDLGIFDPWGVPKEVRPFKVDAMSR